MREILTAGLPAWGVDPSCVPELEKFAGMLLEKNQVMNLTAITEPGQVATLHLLDSLAVLRGADFGGKTVVDVGTGAGFPGLPLAIARADVSVTLLDSLGKRVRFLEEVREALGLQNVTCVHDRAETFARDHREAYDIAVSRAVANLSTLSELCLPLVKVGGVFLAMKSTGCEEEVEAARDAIRRLGGRLRESVDYTIPTTAVTHRLLVIEKRSPTPGKYPRPFAQMKKQPL